MERHLETIMDGVGVVGGEQAPVGAAALSLLLKGHFHFKQIRGGVVIDEWDAENKIPNGGLDNILAQVFTGSTQITTWYVGLMNGTPTVAAADTMASHAGWTENAAYSEGVRQTYTGVEGSQQVTNTASPATFTINAGSQTIGGAFIVQSNVKSGATGVLIAGAAFTGGNRTPASGDQIVVTYVISAASVN